jgi:branched-chain amino acid aminotransferase
MSSNARIGVLDRGFLFADGVFDTMVAAGGTAMAANSHLERLVKASASLGIAIERAEIADLVCRFVADLDGRDAIVRTTVTRGEASRGLWPGDSTKPTIVLTGQPWDCGLVGRPARLIVASIPRNERSPLSRIKSLAYLDNILAAREAAEAAADDALILNTQGRVACSTIANLFALFGRRLLTPPSCEGCLEGIVRAMVLEDAAGEGLDAAQAPLSPADLGQADAVFLTNSVRLIRPVTAIAGSAIASSAVVERLLDRLLSRLEPTRQ